LKQDYSGFSQGGALDLDVKDLLVKNLTKGTKVDVALSFSELEWSIVKAGGKLAAIQAKQNIKQLQFKNDFYLRLNYFANLILIHTIKRSIGASLISHHH